MYAIIESGGKQYRFNAGDLVKVERLAGEVGDSVTFERVVLVGSEGGVEVGTPLVDGARVMGTIVEQGKGDKVTVFKFKKRKMQRRKRGHRQLFTAVRIESIETGAGVEKAPRARKGPEPAATPSVEAADETVAQVEKKVPARKKAARKKTAPAEEPGAEGKTD